MKQSISKIKTQDSQLNFENIKIQNLRDSDGIKEGSIYDHSPEFSSNGNSIKGNAIFDEKVSIHESMYKRSQCSRNSIVMKKKKEHTMGQKIRDLEGMIDFKNKGNYITEWSPNGQIEDF